MEWSMEQMKRLLGIEVADASKDISLQFAMCNVEEIVKNYCNLEEIPSGLYATCCRMTMDLYRAAGIGEEVAPLAVASVSEGDTSTSFGNELTELLSGGLLKNYTSQLNRYRRLRW